MLPPDLTDLAEEFTLTPAQALGIPFALIGAVLLALGAQFQSQGVAKVEAGGTTSSGGISMTQLKALLGRPSWVLGTVMLGLAVLSQLVSLRLAPLLVVQPLGAVALVITAIVNSRVSKHKLEGATIRAIAFCVGGIAIFVTIAAFTAVERPIDDRQLLTVLGILGAVLLVSGLLFGLLRRRFKALFYIVAAGVLYGFVATLAKIVINRIVTGNFEWLTITCIVALLLATALGGYFVQSAYSSGPPDLVIAGLTVIDPLIAVVIGIVVLGEAQEAPLFAVIAFIVAGALAMYGVFQLAKHHPQTRT